MRILARPDILMPAPLSATPTRKLYDLSITNLHVLATLSLKMVCVQPVSAKLAEMVEAGVAVGCQSRFRGLTSISIMGCGSAGMLGMPFAMKTRTCWRSLRWDGHASTS